MKPAAKSSGGRFDRLRTWLRVRAGVLAYAAFTLLVFGVVLATTLPHDLIVARALDAATAGAPVRVGFRTVALAFPNGYRFTDLRITPAGASQPVATLDALTVRVPLGSLLTGRVRQAVISGRAYGGEVGGSVRQAGPRLLVTLDAKGIRLEPALSPFVPPPGRVQGVAALSLQLAGDGRTTQSSEGTVTLAVRDLDLEQVTVRGLRLPDVAFPTVDVAAEVFGTRLQLREARATGDELRFDASGDVLLREPLAQSVLNLRTSIEVPGTAKPGLRLIAGLLPKRAPGEAPSYTVKGTLAAPVLR